MSIAFQFSELSLRLLRAEIYQAGTINYALNLLDPCNANQTGFNVCITRNNKIQDNPTGYSCKQPPNRYAQCVNFVHLVNPPHSLFVVDTPSPLMALMAKCYRSPGT
jgi:hypothetical protein